ncbi:MAG: 5-methyltetrahydropteroyltriglutamate--homocysteine S-methyltransferase [Chloroflexota bacterium]|nr:5-methyltetrahydropteroyltriglutamate--homocysteine S-methyltransferase [Chloroflexota bacterium]
MTYRTDHVGSLVRPERLLVAREAFKAGRLPLEELRAVEDECILDAFQRQKDIGIEVITDGEFRRQSYTTDQYDAIEGFAAEYPKFESTRPDGVTVMVQRHTKPVVGKLRQLRRLTGHESTFLLAHAPGQFKVTMPTPLRNPGEQPSIPPPYTSFAEINADITGIFRDEMLALADEGVTYLQLDKVPTRFMHEDMRKAMRAQGVDPDEAFAEEVALENSCYDAVRREGLTLAMHFCRGNRTWWQGGSGAYDAIAEQAFAGLHADRFLLEYDTERAGGFEPLRFVPKDKSVHLGLVSTKNGELEDQDALLHRIDEAARFIDVDQLGIGPQCGFHSASERDGANMTEDQQWRKLELIVDTASKVWG